MSKYKDFTDYLSEIHADRYVGLDDDMPDCFNDWLVGMDTDTLIHHADMFALIKKGEGIDEAKEAVKRAFDGASHE